MQIHIIGKCSKSVADFRRGTDFERGAEVKFADLDAMRFETSHDIARLFVLQREMASVVVHAEMRGEARIVRMFGGKLVEELRGLSAVLKQPQRLRLDAEVQRAPAALTDALNVFDTTPQIFPNLGDLQFVSDKFLERAGQRADAAFDAGRHKLRE